ncbi:MAG: hypothetical protein NC432_07160 [Roseburia sp.]|nr:hypothetical protein [Roseburia sp.]MCM1098931.1 hypothetical protein [Ruminococcus flavefaciens]
MRRREKKQGRISLDKKRAGGIAAALVAALAVFIAMLQVEKNAMTSYEKGTVYVAAREIPRGQMITEENYSRYFTQRELEKSCIAATALRSPEQITGLAAGFDIEPGVLLTEGMFEKRSDILKTMKEPVVAGFKADDLYQVVGGTLRAGDRIHIYRVTEGAETVLVWDNVYVQEVFDQTGTRIENGDANTAVQRINVYLDKKDVETFYSELASGTLRVVKKID